MKKQEKTFDCIKMKNNIQAEILKERKNFKNEKEWQNYIQKKLLQQPRFARILNQANKLNKKVA